MKKFISAVQKSVSFCEGGGGSAGEDGVFQQLRGGRTILWFNLQAANGEVFESRI